MHRSLEIPREQLCGNDFIWNDEQTFFVTTVDVSCALTVTPEDCQEITEADADEGQSNPDTTTNECNFKNEEFSNINKESENNDSRISDCSQHEEPTNNEALINETTQECCPENLQQSSNEDTHLEQDLDCPKSSSKQKTELDCPSSPKTKKKSHHKKGMKITNSFSASVSESITLKVPVNFYYTEYGVIGMGVPVLNEHLLSLQLMNVGLLISLCLEPLHPGRNINHQPSDKITVEYTMVDKNLWDGVSGINLLHLPISDGYPPTSACMKRFLQETQKTIDSGKRVAIHCWQGKGRTATVIAGYLIYEHHFRPMEAIDFVRDLCPGAINSVQMSYLTNEAFPENTEEENQPKPEILTPPHLSCYQSDKKLCEAQINNLLSRVTKYWHSGDSDEIHILGM